MALQVSFDYNSYNYPTAYVNATLGRSDKETTVVIVSMWPTQADREANRPALHSSAEIFQTNMANIAANPIEYAYKLLKTLPKYASATDV